MNIKQGSQTRTSLDSKTLCHACRSKPDISTFNLLFIAVFEFFVTQFTWVKFTLVIWQTVNGSKTFLWLNSNITWLQIFEYHVSQRGSGGTELTNKVPLKHSVDKNIKPLLWLFSDFIPESPLIVHKLQWEAVFLWHNSNVKSFNSYCLHFNKHSSWLLNLWVFFA